MSGAIAERQPFSNLASQDISDHFRVVASDFAHSGAGPISTATDKFSTEVLHPYIDGLEIPNDLDEFNETLHTLDTSLGHISSVDPMFEYYAGRTVDRAEVYSLDTKILPLAFPDRTAPKDLGKLSFRALGIYRACVSNRLRISEAGYTRMMSPAAERMDIAAAYLTANGHRDAANDLIEPSRTAARIENDRRDDRLDNQLDVFSVLYARKMKRIVRFGSEYTEFFDTLIRQLKDKVGARELGFVGGIEPRGDTRRNVVAKTRQRYLEHVFSLIS